MTSPTQSYFQQYNEHGQAVRVPRPQGKLYRLPTAYEKEQARPRLTPGMVMTYITLCLGCLFIGGLIGLAIVWLLTHFTAQQLGWGLAGIGLVAVVCCKLQERGL